MTIDVDIQVEAGKVTITVGGQSSSNSNNLGTVVSQGNVGAGKKGGEGAAENPGPGGGGPGSGVLVIGPIVIVGSVLQSANVQATPGAGETGGEGAAENPGPGGNPPGSGVVVIGPIVLCGATSSHAAAAPGVAPPAPVPARAAAPVPPPAARATALLGALPATLRHFTMQPQEEHFWCWAAVAASIYQFLDPTSSANWTQGTLATPVLQQEGSIPARVDCSQTPDLCNFPAKLDDALAVAENLKEVLPDEYLTFANLQQWVDNQLPVCARIVWFGGGAHFIALDGYRVFSLGAQQVHVQDPLYGPSFQFYDDLVSQYPPGGNWQDTYLVKK
jgi:hypothetical protein